MLQNAYLLAKIGVDTAENERIFAENLPKICKKYTRAASTARGRRSRPAGQGGSLGGAYLVDR